MKVTVTLDTEHAEKLRKALKDNGGYCPCAVFKTDDTKCMCKDFRDKIADESFEGFCHCGLYYKSR